MTAAEIIALAKTVWTDDEDITDGFGLAAINQAIHDELPAVAKA